MFSPLGRVDILCLPLCMFLVLFQSKKPFLIQRRGAEFSLTTVARHFGADLTTTLPYLWENTVGPLRAVVTEHQCIGMLIWWITLVSAAKTFSNSATAACTVCTVLCKKVKHTAAILTG